MPEQKTFYYGIKHTCQTLFQVLIESTKIHIDINLDFQHYLLVFLTKCWQKEPYVLTSLHLHSYFFLYSFVTLFWREFIKQGHVNRPVVRERDKRSNFQEKIPAEISPMFVALHELTRTLAPFSPWMIKCIKTAFQYNLTTLYCWFTCYKLSLISCYQLILSVNFNQQQVFKAFFRRKHPSGKKH